MPKHTKYRLVLPTARVVIKPAISTFKAMLFATLEAKEVSKTIRLGSVGFVADFCVLREVEDLGGYEQEPCGNWQSYSH